MFLMQCLSVALQCCNAVYCLHLRGGERSRGRRENREMEGEGEVEVKEKEKKRKRKMIERRRKETKTPPDIYMHWRYC